MKTSAIMQGLLVLAASFVMAYLGITSVSHIGEFSPWASNIGWFGLLSALCGVLLTLGGYRAEKAIWAIVAAASLSVVVFGLAWGYVCWGLIRPYLSFWEVLRSDFVLVYVIQRGLLMLIVSSASGLLGITIASFIPLWLTAAGEG